MTTAKSLQIPEIIDIKGATIRIKHPDISKYLRTTLRAPFSAAATTISVGDNHGYADDDFLLIGEVTDPKAEEIDINGAVTRGSSLTITNTTKFDHETEEPVTRIYERKFTVYGASSDGGSLTAIVATGSAKNIQWNQPWSEYTLVTGDTAYAYYVVKFYDGTTESSASDYVASTGHSSQTMSKFIMDALDITGAKLYKEVTWEYLIKAANDCQDDITQFAFQDGMKKDWAFEMTGKEDSNNWITSLVMENRYSLSDLGYDMKYEDTNQSNMSVQFGHLGLLAYISPKDYEKRMRGVKRAELSAATSVGATSITLKDSSMMSTTGTVKIGGDTLTYTANSTSTGVLSGIPATGSNSITEVFAVGRSVWQGVSGGLPQVYTVFDGNFYLDVPINSTYSNYKLKFRYYRKLDPLTQISDTTLVTFTQAFQYYLAEKIELRRQQPEMAAQYRGRFESILLKNAQGQKSSQLDTYSYYRFGSSRLGNRERFDYNDN